MNYDSRPDTWEHIHNVQRFLVGCVNRLLQRALLHDQSKLHSPEREVFDKFTPMLKGLTYGSDEYKATLREMGPAVAHHQKKNRHHPEYFGERGIGGMNLIDLLEMLCDWKAASLRHADGDILRSIEINQERFGYTDELKGVLVNTVKYMIWDMDAPFLRQRAGGEE